jgi:hypothetical protein
VTGDPWVHSLAVPNVLEDFLGLLVGQDVCYLSVSLYYRKVITLR